MRILLKFGGIRSNKKILLCFLKKGALFFIAPFFILKKYLPLISSITIQFYQELNLNEY